MSWLLFDAKKICVACVGVFLWFGLCAVSHVHTDPIFVSRADTTGCEGEWLYFSIFADALFREDELSFFMEGAPEGAILDNLGKCG